MAFVLVEGFNNQYLLFDKFKFRNSYTYTNGHLSWRCCNKSCKSWIKTDKNKSKIIDSKVSHNHSPQPDNLTNKTPKEVKTTNKPRTDNTARKTPVPTNSTPERASMHLTSSTPTQSLTDSSFNSGRFLELESQNGDLQKQVTELNKHLEIMTAHAIDSDARLLHYTDQLVVSSRSIMNTNTTETQDDMSLNSDECEAFKQKIARLERQLNDKEQEIIRLQEALKVNQSNEINNHLVPKVLVSVSCQTVQERRDKKITKLNLEMYDKIKNLEDVIYEQNIVITDLAQHFEDREKNNTNVTKFQYKEVTGPTFHNHNTSSNINTFKAKCFELPLQNRFQVLTNSKSSQEKNDNIHSGFLPLGKLPLPPKPKFRPNKINKPKCVHSEVPDLSIDSGNSIPSENMDQRYNENFHVSGTVLILSDSHGRDLYSSVQGLVKQNVTTIVRSGAPLDKVSQGINYFSKGFTKTDTIVVIGGTNDVETHKPRRTLATVNFLLRCTRKTNLVIATIPSRHDKPELWDNVSYLNEKIRESCSRFKHCTVLPLDELPRHYYTAHGLHYNKQGKRVVGCSIANLVQGMADRHSRSQSDENMCEEDAITWDNNHPISVIENNMWNVIEDYQNNEDAAFAHCVSEDLRMGAGVAVVFRKNFGRPERQEYCSDRLACQRTAAGSTVYSLITKPLYYDKPDPEVYDRAFQELTYTFKKDKFKHLICSPMGCVRDNITIQHFGEQIVKFQRETGALVTVVTYDEKSNQKLRNGLTHSQLVKSLREVISKLYEIETPKQPQVNSQQNVASESESPPLSPVSQTQDNMQRCDPLSMSDFPPLLPPSTDLQHHHPQHQPHSASDVNVSQKLNATQHTYTLTHQSDSASTIVGISSMSETHIPDKESLFNYIDLSVSISPQQPAKMRNDFL